jgi:hypothetical protein
MSIRFDPEELRELEERLTERLESIAPTPRPSAGQRVRTELAATQQRRGPAAWLAAHPLTPAWPRYAAVAAVVVAALAVGIGIGSSGLFNAAHSPAPSPSGPAFGETWRQVDVVPPATHATDLVEDGYAGPTRTVLVGERGGPQEAGGDTTAAAWYTDDGITWHTSEINGVDPNLDVHGLTVVFGFADNLYAIGPADPQSGQGSATSGSVIVELESTDGGATWIQLTDVNPPAGFDGVMAAGPGLVAVSAASALVWSSTDGRTWIAHSTPNTARVAGESLYAVASHGDELIAVGQAWQTPSGDGISGIVMTSSDGVHWTRQTPPDGFAPRDVTWADGAWLMAGYRGGQDGGTPEAAILRSTDGLTWSPVDLAPAPGSDDGTQMVSITAGADGVVAIGGGGSSTGPSFSAWTSSDGASWELQALPDGPVGSGQAVTALVRSGQVIVAGNGWSASRDRLPAVWISPAAAPQPTPTASASSELPAANIYQTWDRADLPQGILRPRGNPHDVVAFRGTLIVVGGAETGSCNGVGCVVETSAAVWYRDTTGWVRLPDQSSFAAGAMESAAATADRLLVLGETTSSPRGQTGEGNLWPELWISTDGLQYEAYDAPAEFNAIMASTDGSGAFLAAALTGDGRSEIWRSLDGRAWERVADAHSLGAGEITTLRAVGGTVIALGTTYSTTAAGDQIAYGTVWTSTGGQPWTRHDDPFSGVAVSDVAARDGRLVAVGTDTAGNGAVWISDDLGQSWSRSSEPALEGHRLGFVLSVSGGFLALGDPTMGPPEVWVSLTGERWDPVLPQASIGADDWIGPMTIAADGTAAFIGIHDPGGSKTTSIWTSAGPGPSAAPTPTAAPSLPAPSVFADWTRVNLPDPAPKEFGGTILRFIVRFGNRWIAVGFVNGGCCAGAYSEATRGVIWTSTDGEHWKLVPAQASLAHARIVSVASNGSHLVAVGVIDTKTPTGEANPVAASWYSDDGVTWHVVRNTPLLDAVTAAGSQFVAAATSGQGVEIYTSPDGRSWSWMVTSAAEYLAGATVGIDALAGRTDGSAVCTASVAQADGTAEELTIRLDLTKRRADVRQAPISGMEVTAPAPAGDGWIAMGTSSDGTQVMHWESADGLTWSGPTVIDSDPGGEAQANRIVAAGADLVVAGGTTGAGGMFNAAVWVLTGGAWYRVSSPDAFSGLDNEIGALAWDAAGQRILAVGSHPDGSHPAPVLWIASR